MAVMGRLSQESHQIVISSILVVYPLSNLQKLNRPADWSNFFNKAYIRLFLRPRYKGEIYMGPNFLTQLDPTQYTTDPTQRPTQKQFRSCAFVISKVTLA